VQGANKSPAAQVRGLIDYEGRKGNDEIRFTSHELKPNVANKILAINTAPAVLPELAVIWPFFFLFLCPINCSNLFGKVKCSQRGNKRSK